MLFTKLHWLKTKDRAARNNQISLGSILSAM